MKGDRNYTCSFFGHSKTEKNEKQKEKVRETVENLIAEENVFCFLFGSKSGFDRICLEVVNEMKEKYPHIKRIYVRAEYPEIGEGYWRYLSQFYDESYFPKKIRTSGRAVYVERNFEMIENSRFCVIHYDANLAPTTRKSGTESVWRKAEKEGREIIFI